MLAAAKKRRRGEIGRITGGSSRVRYRVPIRQMPYRLSLSDRADDVHGPSLGRSLEVPGTIYARGGGTGFGRRPPCYGGAGDDDLTGTKLFGGPGNDYTYGYAGRGTNLTRGGPGRDTLRGSGWM